MLDLRSLRRPLLGVTVLASIALLATVLWVLATSRSDLYRRETSEVQAELQAYVEGWERGLVGELDLILETAASGRLQEARSLQERLRLRDVGIDALYIWVLPPADDGSEVKLRATLVFPDRADAEDTQLVYEHECLARARGLSDDPLIEAATVAEAYLQDCRLVDDLAVRLRASAEAARFLSEDGRNEEALQALDSVPVSVKGRLEQGVRLGVAPYRLVTHRTQRSQVLHKLGRHELALQELSRTGLELLELDAPALDRHTLQYVRWPILKELEDAGWDDDVEQLLHALARAERRQRAWREVDERILPRYDEPVSEPARFVYDQYDAARPFLIYYGTADNGRLGVALHLDQQELLKAFLMGLRPELRRSVAIADASGAWQAGPGLDEQVLFEVPFDETLNHLRVGVGVGVVDARVAVLETQWRWILSIVFFAALVTFLAIWALYRATLQQDRMLERQREFTTRVTHELRTPLAGIRVMAENLQLGAFKSPAQLEMMAGRIVNEADRLTERVNQILASARAPTLPKKQPFDPEEAVLEAIDMWGPRLEAGKVTLSADLHATAEVVGDMESVRDAVGCLLDNALKYRRPGVASRVELTLTEEGGWVVIDVTDNGLGVPKERRREIFERFVRVEGPHRGLAGGHGLGLAQVASTIKAHGGKVRCVDGIDGGARFSLRLPARR